MDKRRALVMAGSLIAGAAAAMGGGPSMEIIANRGQAMPKGALDAVRGSRSDRRRELRMVTRELVGVQGIVLGHIHPRWLRAEVEAKLDAGEDVDEAWLIARRARG